MDGSSDGGRTWERTPYFAVPDTHILRGKLPSTDGAEGATEVQVGLIQPSIWASSPTAVHVLCRSNGGAIYRADSVDGGVTWSAARRTSMPNNNSVRPSRPPPPHIPDPTRPSLRNDVSCN